MEKHSIQSFVETYHLNHDSSFGLQNDRTLRVKMGQEIWIKLGAMIAYEGHLSFEREKMLSNGIGNLLKKFISGEGCSLVRVTGEGELLLADNEKKIHILKLNNESIVINGNDILSLDFGVKHDITMMKRISGTLQGGLFNVRCSGNGYLAFTSHGTPTVLKVSKGKPIYTDPNATVAWSGVLEPKLKTDISFRTFLGRGNGESFQMEFDGEGFVVVQPHEEIYWKATNNEQ